MDVTTTTSAIPMTAWEQSVVVVLFVVAFLAIVGYLLNWFSKQQKSWQEFIAKNNSDWRSWLEDQNKRETESMGGVISALNKLSEKIDTHDDKVDARFSRAQELLSKTQPRPKRNV